MTAIARKRREARIARHARVRKKISGTAERPRLCVYRSLKHIYAQIIDDQSQKCLLTVSSLTKEVQDQAKGGKGKKSLSTVVGKVLAEKAKAAGIEAVTFDRGGYLYHGRVQALAEGAREGGLKL